MSASPEPYASPRWDDLQLQIVDDEPTTDDQGNERGLTPEEIDRLLDQPVGEEE